MSKIINAVVQHIGHSVHQVQTTVESMSIIALAILLPFMMLFFVARPVARHYGEAIAAYGPLVNILWPVAVCGIILIPAFYVSAYNHIIHSWEDRDRKLTIFCLLVAWLLCGLVGLYCLTVFFAEGREFAEAWTPTPTRWRHFVKVSCLQESLTKRKTLCFNQENGSEYL